MLTPPVIISTSNDPRHLFNSIFNRKVKTLVSTDLAKKNSDTTLNLDKVNSVLNYLSLQKNNSESFLRCIFFYNFILDRVNLNHRSILSADCINMS